MSEFLLGDCMEYMKDMADNAFELAIVDPPYGIDVCNMQLGNSNKNVYRGRFNWDSKPPSAARRSA